MNINDIFKQVTNLNSEFSTIKAKLAALKVTGEAGAGLVKVTMDCNFMTLAVDIDTSLLQENTLVLQDLVAAANRDAVTKATELKQQTLQSAIKDLGIPLDLANFFAS